MKDIDLRYLCKVIGNLSGVPIRIFHGENLIFYHSVVGLPKDPMEIYHDDIMTEERFPLYRQITLWRQLI